MRSKTCLTGLLLAGLLAWFGPPAFAVAELGIEFAPQNPGLNQTITFTVIVVTGDPQWFFHEDELFEWDLDNDGEYDDATGRTAERAFATAGEKTVGVRGLDDRAGWHHATATVTVTNVPPVACLTYLPSFPAVGEPVQFDASCSTDSDGTIARYTWEIDGAAPVDGVVTRAHAFQSSGQRPVKLTVMDNGGATHSITVWVTVQTAPPVAAFSYMPANPTVYDEIEFNATGSYDPDGAAIVSYRWAFGDGRVVEGSQHRVVTHQYLNGGTYQVQLWVTDGDAEVGYTSKQVAVLGPTAAFTFSPQNPTTQTPVQFHDQSHDLGGQIISWSWNFGDGAVSSAQHPLRAFPVAGEYLVRLTITSQGTAQRTATHSTTRTIQVRNAPPVARFVFSPESPKVDAMITFSAEGSSDADGYVASFEWDFNNDGITDATGSTVTYAFSSVGAKMVRLRVTDNQGAQSTVVKVVPVQAEAPIACFTFTPGTPYTGQMVGFNASCSSDPDGNIVLYEWDFTGNGQTDATGMSVSRSFPAAGVYPVTLKVTDNDGLVAVETQGVPVQVGGTSGDNQPPVADFTFEPEEGPDVNLHEVVTFKADGSSDPDGTIISYEWDLDRDGVYDATGSTVTHIFHTGGAKIVTLRVTDNEGSHGYKSKVVSVEFVRPSAEFEYTPEAPRVGDVVGFDASGSSDRDGTVEFYEWDFTGDGRADATGQMVNHVFDAGGRVSVTLTVTDNDGITGLITRHVTVEINNPPTASFTYEPESPTVADTIEFTNTSEDTDGTIVSHLWDFGDGESSTGENPTHKYGEPGTYVVSLTVTDNDAATVTARETLVISTAPNTLVVDFEWSPAAPPMETDVTFTDKSSVDEGTSIASWSWVWKLGRDVVATSTEQNPILQFAVKGEYSVTLTVTDSLDNEGEKTKTMTVVNGDDDPNPVRLHAYPNPATQQATFNVYLPAGATSPELWIFDLNRNQLLRQALPAGATQFEWDLRDAADRPVANGIYFCMITATSDAGRRITSGVFRLLVARAR